MSINIEQTLKDRFAAPLSDNYKRRIIFWQDPDGEFSDLVDELFLDSVKILATVTDAPISVVPDAPTLASVTPDLNISLWNGLFVHKDTPADVREKIIASAQETMASARAQELAAQTGAIVYWMDAQAAAARIASDIEVSGRIATMLAE